MHCGKILFTQVLDYLPWEKFERIVKRYNGDKHVRNLSCSEQFRILAFAQLTYRESLRDIEVCLGAQRQKLYHMGIRRPVAKSTLSDANETRDWRIYAEFAQKLIAEARELYIDEELGLDLAGTLYALDSTTIDLCMSVFPWASFRSTKSAVKMHTLLDLKGPIPSFIHVSNGNVHDVNVLDILPLESGAYYVMDRAYVDFERLHRFIQAKAFFVTRSKIGLKMRRIYSAESDKENGIICDQTVELSGLLTSKSYPEKLRRIRFKDPETQKALVFLTNDFLSSAPTIAKLYKARWKVELFFKWIKQHLRIKRFYGTSENAVKTQIWIAVSVYVLIAIVKKRLNLEASLYTLLQVLSVSIFEKIQLSCAFENPIYTCSPGEEANQLNLFGN